MAKDIIGIDISDASIEAIVLSKKGNNFVVDTYSRFRLSPEIMAAGKVINPSKLQEALALLFKNAQPRAMDPAKVYLSVSESRVFNKVFKFPKNLNDKEIKEAAVHTAEEMIPEDVTQLYSASQILPTQNNHKEVWYVTAEKEAVLGLAKVFQDQNIGVAGVTTESVSAYYGLHDKFKNNKTLLLDIGSNTTIACIYDHVSIRDSININIAGFNIIEAMIKRFAIDYIKAEELIRDVGLTAAPGDGEVMLLIQGQLQPLLDEVKRFVEYYQTANQIKLEQVVLIGGLAQMRGIVNYFNANLNLPTFIGETFLASSNGTAIAFTKYINALGLARLTFEKNNINFFAEIDKKSLQQELTQNQAPLTESVPANIDEAVTPTKGLSKYIKSLKNIFASLYFALFILLLGLGGTVYFFRQPLQNILVKETVFTVPGQKIIVAIKSPSSGTKNFVYAQSASFTLNQEKDYPDIPYAEAKDKILLSLSEEVLSELNKKYSQSNYYIIPQIISQSIISINPAEKDFKIGQSISLQASFSFLAVASEDVKQALASSAGADQAKILASSVENIDYKVISWDKNSQFFVLEVDAKLKAK